MKSQRIFYFEKIADIYQDIQSLYKKTVIKNLHLGELGKPLNAATNQQSRCFSNCLWSPTFWNVWVKIITVSKSKVADFAARCLSQGHWQVVMGTSLPVGRLPKERNAPHSTQLTTELLSQPYHVTWWIDKKSYIKPLVICGCLTSAQS